VSLLSLIIWAGATINCGIGKKMFGLFFIGLSFVLLVGSKSTNSLLICVTLLILASVLYASRKFLRPVVGEIISSILVLSFFASLIVIFFLESNALSSLVGLFEKDISFTGRTDIWSLMMEEIKNHWIFGCGFQGYWSTPKPSLEMLLYDLRWQINTAHQGYLDILNETGIIGFSIFLTMMIYYFINLWHRGKPHFGSWIVIGVLNLNFMESTLFHSDDVCGCLLLLSYLSLYAYPAQEASGVA
jgi:O-antigen ligase